MDLERLANKAQGLVEIVVNEVTDGDAVRDLDKAGPQPGGPLKSLDGLPLAALFLVTPSQREEVERILRVQLDRDLDFPQGLVSPARKQVSLCQQKMIVRDVTRLRLDVLEQFEGARGALLLKASIRQRQDNVRLRTREAAGPLETPARLPRTTPGKPGFP